MKTRTIICRLTVSVLAGCLGACASLQDVHLHDPTQAAAAAEAETSFNLAKNQDLWQTMARNVEASSVAEKAVLAKSAEQRFEGQLQNIEGLTWQDVKDCGSGLCWTVEDGAKYGVNLSAINLGLLHDQSTEQKIAYVAGEADRLVKEIAMLRDSISTLAPVTETSPLEVASNLHNAIAEIENNVATLEANLTARKEERLQRLEANLERLLQPVINPMPEQSSRILETVRGALEQIRQDMELVDSVRALPTELRDAIIAELSLDFPESFPPEVKREFASRLNEYFGFEEMTASLTSPLTNLNEILKGVDADLGSVEDLAIAALGADQNLSTRLHAITDLLRKSEHLDLVKLESVESMLNGDGIERLRDLGDQISITDTLDELKRHEISEEFRTAFVESAKRDLCSSTPCTVGDVLSYLATDESKLEAIRTELRDDFRRAATVAYNYDLQTLQREVEQMKELAAILRDRHLAERNLASLVENHFNAYGEPAPSTTIYHQLDCLARSAGATHGEGCEADTKRARDRFANTLVILTNYFALEGELREREIAAWRDIALTGHLRSIESSRIAALAYEQFISSGLQGLTAFTEGGITTEEIASVLRIVNTGLLAVIAGDL